MTIDDLVTGRELIAENLDAYVKAEEAYDGTASERLHPRLARMLGPDSPRYRLDFLAQVVEAVTDALQVTTVEAVPQEESDFLQEQVWADLERKGIPGEINLRTSIFGDAYLFVWPGALTPEGKASTVEFHYNNPKSTRIVYDDEVPTVAKYAIKSWTEGPRGRRVHRTTLYYPERIERWATPPEADPANVASWKLMETRTNPYGQVPIFHFRNGEPYGTPEHYRGYDPAEAINKMSTIQVNTVDYHGYPQRYALTDPDAVADGASMDNPDFDDDADASEQGTERAGLRRTPGSLWMLNGVRGTGEYTAADPDNFLKPLTFYIRALALLTRTPLDEFDLQGEVPSGASRRQARAAFNTKVLKRQAQRGRVWEDVLIFAMHLLDRSVENVTLTWKSPVSIDDEEGWRVVRTKQEVGVPAGKTLEEAGYDPQEVEQWLDDENESMHLAARVQLLSQLADGMQKLSVAATAGLISPEAVQNLLEKLLGSMAPEGTELPSPLPIAPPRPSLPPVPIEGEPAA